MSAIPEKHLEFCRKVAALAAEAGINRATLKFMPGFGDEWQDEIDMHWEQGRHGEDSRRVFVTSTVRVRDELQTPNVELTGAAAALLPQRPATEGSEVERRVGPLGETT